MAGEYRTPEVLQRLPSSVRAPIENGFRIALTSKPINGALIRRDLSTEWARAYREIGLLRYADGLSNGSMVVVEPEHCGNKCWVPGELFLKS